MTEKNLVYVARLHWIIFFWPLALLAASGYVAYSYPSFQNPALFISVISLVWILMMWASYTFSQLVIKKKQVILRTGILVRKTVDIPMSKIESIDISQSIIGSIFRYGTLMITGTGGTRQLVSYINRPLTCRRYIEQQLHE